MEFKFRLLRVIVPCLVVGIMTACASNSTQTATVTAPEPSQQVSSAVAPEPAAREIEIDQDQLARSMQAYQDNLDIMRFVYEDVYFDYNKAELKPVAVEELKRKAEWLRRHPQTRVIIEGHCDERGSNEHNLGLGEKRAGAIKSFLIEQGISPGRMTTISYGEERPVDEGHNEEAWAKNRRAHLALP